MGPTRVPQTGIHLSVWYTPSAGWTQLTGNVLFREHTHVPMEHHTQRRLLHVSSYASLALDHCFRAYWTWSHTTAFNTISNASCNCSSTYSSTPSPFSGTQCIQSARKPTPHNTPNQALERLHSYLSTHQKTSYYTGLLQARLRSSMAS